MFLMIWHIKIGLGVAFVRLHPITLVDNLSVNLLRALCFFAANLDTLEKVEVVYKTMSGWKESLSSVRNYDDLPGNAKTYIKFIEDYLDVPGNGCFSLLNFVFKL